MYVFFMRSPVLVRMLNTPFQDHRSISPEEIRSLANATAVLAVEDQKAEFRELGIMADWDGTDSTYRTLGQRSLGCTPERHVAYNSPRSQL